MKKIILFLLFTNFAFGQIFFVPASGWKLTGNPGTLIASKLGTNDNRGQIIYLDKNTEVILEKK